MPARSSTAGRCSPTADASWASRRWATRLRMPRPARMKPWRKFSFRGRSIVGILRIGRWAWSCRMGDDGMITDTERLLLMAAAVHGLGPNNDMRRANAAKLVEQALQWLGLSVEEINRQCPDPESPRFEEVHNALVRMVHQLQRDRPGRQPERPG